VIRTLLELGYTPTVAYVGGHLAAVKTAYNWQGNARIAVLVGRCKRTVQRARARLEHDGLIRSELLLTGDRLEGQRAPVLHPQVVRDVSPLQRLARVQLSQLPGRRRKRRGPSAAETPAPAPQKRQDVSAADFERWASENPDPVLAQHFRNMATEAAKREQAKRPPPVPAPTPGEIDAWDAETERRERELRRRDQLEREREPRPPRGPPR
jgi:hypothetical protein